MVPWLTLIQAYDWPSASEVTLKDMGKLHATTYWCGLFCCQFTHILQGCLSGTGPNEMWAARIVLGGCCMIILMSVISYMLHRPQLRGNPHQVRFQQLQQHWAVRPSIHSLRPSDAYTRHQPRPSFVQRMAWRLFGAKPLSEPMMPYCQLNPKEHIEVKL